MRRRMLKTFPSRRLIEDQSGFSLVEIIIVLIILGVSLVPISQVSIQNAYYGGRFVTMTRALYFAQEIMENVIADYNSTDGTIGGYTNVRSNWPGTVSGAPTGLTGTVSISAEYALSGINCVNVLVRVSGTDIPNVDLTTLLVEN